MSTRRLSVLLLVGAAICMTLTVGICQAVQRNILQPLAVRGKFPLTRTQIDWIPVSLFVAFYAAWACLIWYIARRRARRQPPAFEVLPPRRD